MYDRMYSIRMRAAEGGPHEQGGLHISGGETLVPKVLLEETTKNMLQKALNHSRGDADFIQVIVEKISSNEVVSLAPLSVTTEAVKSVEEGHHRSVEILQSLGVSNKAITNGMGLLKSTTNFRGAVVLSASSGERLDDRGLRGVRATRMGWSHEGYARWSALYAELASPRIAEAIVLATKVAHAPFMIAELCWSDDPEYITGYISSQQNGYVRITHLKEKGDFSGGRVFYVSDDVQMEHFIDFLEQTAVLLV
ncbi:6-carboxyhexanoate--CoA ligase [Aneurinibacillus sp. Ricciae_BoGa-3]|uniref:6-carboxyhexanoate--CoA ligase n=1 Tax=Aneurinibacillus sp. Ricciae_BoGa-3 TaxID=3022697 RepID=UPI00234043EA|nr:6-carboxyhexanoate--CoA ligase [Aneurinibacillus sp. Ricciae_BoGa-3]WCK54551.1 6-carboxyhexanoate--CoA ligase [Aneurinibacillus sp. Ricciae_BoGa-3]